MASSTTRRRLFGERFEWSTLIEDMIGSWEDFTSFGSSLASSDKILLAADELVFWI
jgi:hypothetical protein